MGHIILLKLPLIFLLVEKLNIPQKTDYIRYHLLHTYGGVWIDTDIIVLKYLTPIIKKLRY